MPLTKLIVEEFEVTENDVNMNVGSFFSYFKDPETGKYYQPNRNFVVLGEDLSNQFVEVPDHPNKE